MRVPDRNRSSHDSLEHITRHLIARFPTVAERSVAREVARAVAAVRWIGLSEDQLLIVELIATAQLELESGDRVDAARLDPQSHPSRARRALAGAGIS